MKKLICFVLTIVVLLPIFSVYAAEVPDTLIVGTAGDIGVSSSKQAILDDYSIKAVESSLQKILDAAKITGTYTAGPEYILNYKVKTIIAPAEAQYNLDIAKRTKEENLISLRLSVYKSIMDILLKQLDLGLEAEKFAIQKENTDMKIAQFNKGNLTEDDIIDAEYTLETKELDLNSKAQSYLESTLQLKKLLNMPLDDEPITIDHEVIFEALPELDLDSVVTTAINNSFSIYKLNLNLDIKQKTMDLTEEYLDEGNATYDRNKLNLETVLLDVEDAKLSLEVSIRNSWNDLLNLQDVVILAHKYEAIALKRFNNCETRYTNEMVSREAYLAEKERYMNAIYLTYSAVHYYNLAKADFEHMTSILFADVE